MTHTGTQQPPKPLKKRRQVLKGNVYIQATYNNTIVTITDARGQVLAWSSAGNIGFKGTRKSTPYAATLAARAAVGKARKFNLREVIIFTRGIGPGRDAAIRGLGGEGIEVSAIIDRTPMPHNGVRPPKPRRV